MNTKLFFGRIVEPTLQLISQMPEIGLSVTDQARVMVMTIAGQESDWAARRQNGGGPARSYWQFERNGGCAEVIAKCPRQMKAICAVLDIPLELNAVFEAMAWNDTLACTMARLLVWQDAKPLPAIGDKEASWDYYNRNWRPGAPHPKAWPAYYDQALAVITAKP